jgi:hypothetical protein
MKFECKYCHKSIEISQSERSRNGLQKLRDHEADCFKSQHPDFDNIINLASRINPPIPRKIPVKIPDTFNMEEIIEYLHHSLGRLPTEGETLRFNMFLTSYERKPTETECTEFIELLRKVNP